MENLELRNKKLIFCFPYIGAGGVPLLFIRLANYLKNDGYNVAIIDYIDGFMSVNNKENLEFIEYKDNNTVNIDENSILILQSMTPWSIYPSLKINDNTNLFFITTIPTNFYPALPIVRDKIMQGGMLAKIIWSTFLRSEYKKVRRFISLSLKKNSLSFLDENIVCNLNNSLKTNIDNTNIIPLFSEDINENKYLKNIFAVKNELIVGWIGRIADFKVHILNRVIEDLKKYSDCNDLKIKFIIIGQGERENVLLDYKTDRFLIERIDHIESYELDKILLKFDLYFAMGTSALDGAKLGVPTVRLDYSFEKIQNDYKYKFLYDVKGYSLGENIDSQCYNKGTYSIDMIIEKVLKEKGKLSTLSYNFYYKNHSLESSVLKFINCIEKSKLIYDDLVKKDILSSKLYSFWKRIR